MLLNLPFLIHDPFIHIKDHLNVIAPNLMKNPTALKREKISVYVYGCLSGLLNDLTVKKLNPDQTAKKHDQGLVCL